MVSIFFPPIKHGILYATAKEKRAYCMQFHGSFFRLLLVPDFLAIVPLDFTPLKWYILRVWRGVRVV